MLIFGKNEKYFFVFYKNTKRTYPKIENRTKKTSIKKETQFLRTKAFIK